MTLLLAINTAGGAVAVIAGYGALLAGKGSPFHRYAGYGSVAGMRVMALGAMAVAPEEGETKHVVTAVLVTYIVWHSCSSRGGVARLTIATPAGIRLPDRARSAADVHADLTMKGIP